MKIAILGGGSIGTRHARNARALGCEVSIVDVDPNCLAVREGFALSAPDSPADAVIICTPAGHHADDIRRCLRSRTPFLVEKPAVLRTADLELSEWATDVPHLVGYNWRFHRSLNQIARIAAIADSITFTCRTNMVDWPGQSYGPRHAECSHELDLALAWCGDVADVVFDAGGWETQIRLVHCNGQVTEHNFLWNWVREQWGRTVVARTPFYASNGYDVSVDLPATGTHLDESYRDELRHFLGVALGSQKSQNTLKQSRKVVNLFEFVVSRDL